MFTMELLWSPQEHVFQHDDGMLRPLLQTRRGLMKGTVWHGMARVVS